MLENKQITEFKKNIQIGGDFEDLILKSSIFVDKSLFIKEIIEDAAKVILITMPRRWGKSLNLDMLYRFLSIEENDAEQKTLNQKIFSKSFSLNITTTNIIIEDSEFIGMKKSINSLDFQGIHPVIYIDFKDCKGINFKDVENKLNLLIDKAIKQFSYLSNSTDAYEVSTIGKKYLSLVETINLRCFSTAIKELCSLLYTYHKKKIWILIDEYDTATNNAYLNYNDEEAKLTLELFRNIYEPILKGNKYLAKAVMTGVQYIVQSGMLSGLNNLSKYNITNIKYSKYYGINQQEMSLLLDHFNIDPKKIDQIKDWYNGYQENIGDSEHEHFINKYNIWSVVNYLNNQQDGLKSYWGESASISFMQVLFKHRKFREKIESLINDIPIRIMNLIVDFNQDNFIQLKNIINDHNIIEIKMDGWDLIFAYLFITGYLTTTRQNGNLEYKFPNKEIKTEFEKKIKVYYQQIFNIDNDKFIDLTQILSRIFEKENIKNIKIEFEENFGPKLFELIKTVILYDKTNDSKTGLFGNEDLMHSLLNYICLQVVNSKFASEKYTTKTDGSKARADIVISKNNIGIIIEMKYNGKIEKILEQVMKYEKLISKNDIRIFLGCNISNHQQIQLFGYIYNQYDHIENIDYSSCS
jgi:hypothetical protein